MSNVDNFKKTVDKLAETVEKWPVSVNKIQKTVDNLLAQLKIPSNYVDFA